MVTLHAWYDLTMKEEVTLEATVALAGGSAGVTVSMPKFLELAEVSGHSLLSLSCARGDESNVINCYIFIKLFSADAFSWVG